MDMGGLYEFLMALLLAGVVAALGLNFVAAFLGARTVPNVAGKQSWAVLSWARL